MKKGGDEDRNGADEQTAKMNADEDRGADEIKERQGGDGKREREKKRKQPGKA